MVLQRLWLFVRGLGVLYLLIGLAVLATAAGKYHWLAGTHATTPPFALTVTAYRALDGGTGTEAAITRFRLLASPSSNTAGNRLLLLLEVALRNREHRAARFDRQNFYALAGSGQTYGSGAATGTLPTLGRGALTGGRKRKGWIAFQLPARPESLIVIWNDDNHLLPPATLARLRLRRLR